MVKKNTCIIYSASFLMMLLILDSQTAIGGAQEGINLCIRSIIPSLFPFIAVSTILTGTFNGFSNTLIRKIFRIPAGSEAIIMSSFLGGYPIGAQCICAAYQTKQLSEKNANQMLMFCNQAGPSFIFGVVALQFPSVGYAWVLWGIQIISAIAVAQSISNTYDSVVGTLQNNHFSISLAVRRSVSTMAIICGWVVLFRVIIAFADRWILWIVPTNIKYILYGLLELSNGCISLSEITSLNLRFITAALLLSCGGLCVSMQTASVINGLSLKAYLKGKLLQLLYSVILSVIVICFISNSENTISVPAMILCMLIIILPVTIRKIQKRVAYGGSLVYNSRKRRKKVAVCCLERKLSGPAPTVSTAPSWMMSRSSAQKKGFVP